MRATTNKQTDGLTGWRWPLTFLGGERATRESELSRPLYHAGWVALLLIGLFVLLLAEAVLIGRGLPLSFGLLVLWWLARPALAGGVAFPLRLALAVFTALLAGLWLFWLGPALLWRGWFPVWYEVTPEWFIVHGNARGVVLPLWVLWLRLLVIVALPVVYVAAGGPVLLRFWQEILLPGLSAVRAFPVDIWRLPIPPFCWLRPTEDATPPVETQTLIGPDLEDHTEPLTHTHTTMRSNGSGRSWRREVVALNLTDAQWTEIARRALGGVGWTDGERLPGIALHDWRRLRQALARVQWLDNPTGRRYELTEYGREQFERIAAGDYSPLGR